MNDDGRSRLRGNRLRHYDYTGEGSEERRALHEGEDPLGERALEEEVLATNSEAEAAVVPPQRVEVMGVESQAEHREALADHRAQAEIGHKDVLAHAGFRAGSVGRARLGRANALGRGGEGQPAHHHQSRYRLLDPHNTPFLF